MSNIRTDDDSLKTLAELKVKLAQKVEDIEQYNKPSDIIEAMNIINNISECIDTIDT